jgi:hypothetical protein
MDKYNISVIFHNLRITMALSKAFQSAVHSHTHCSVTASSNQDSLDHAVVQAFCRWLPTAATWVDPSSGHVGFVLERHWGRFSLSTSVSTATHSTDCSTLIIIHHLGLEQ